MYIISLDSYRLIWNETEGDLNAIKFFPQKLSPHIIFYSDDGMFWKSKYGSGKYFVQFGITERP